MLEDLRRNITYLNEYDEKSFIGLWIDDGVWSDVEYWKLEKDLLKIINHNNEKNCIQTHILGYVMRVIQLMMVSNWENFSIFDEHEKYTLNEDWGEPDIFDRYERFKYVIGVLFDKKNDLDNIEFGYQLKE